MKLNRSNIVRIGLVAFGLFLSQKQVSAATNGFVVPPFRGQPNTEYGYWENFSVAVGAPGNAADQPGKTTGAVITQTNLTAIVAGSGNLYNPGGNSAFFLTNSAAASTIVLQIRTSGTELDYKSVSLVYSDINGSHFLAPLFRYELNRVGVPGQGSSVSSLWQWDLAGLNIANYEITFNASGSSLSLDSVILDTAQSASTNFADVAAFPQQPFAAQSQVANIARWNYLASDFGLQRRATASVFGAVGLVPDFDSRDAQFLLGWNTAGRIPAGQGSANYLVRRVRVTLTIASGGQYPYTGQLRDYRSYFPTNDPRFVAPATSNSPVELYGAGFRGGFTNENNAYVPWASTNYSQDGPYLFDSDNESYYTNRAAYAAGYNTSGVLVDVSDNIGDDGTNEIFTTFEVAPFAVGQTTNVTEGQLMPAGSQLTFDLNLNDPLVYRYVQQGLNDGNLSFMVSSLVASSQPPAPATFPAFYTIFSPIATTAQFPLIDVEGEIVRTNVDSDADGLPDDWENFYFGSLANNGTGSFANDGVSNLQKYLAGTDPRSSTNNFRLLSVQHDQGSSEIHFAGAPNRQYTMLQSADLQNWQAVTNPALTYSSAWLAKTETNATYPSPVYLVGKDTNAVSAQGFYRVGTK
jgi:hypothetical protein